MLNKTQFIGLAMLSGMSQLDPAEEMAMNAAYGMYAAASEEEQKELVEAFTEGAKPNFLAIQDVFEAE